MTKLWLPLGRPLYAVPRDEREELANRLYALRVMIPGWREMEIQQLRDYVEWQEGRAEDDAKKALLRPAHRQGKLTRAEVITGLKEFRAYNQPRQEGRRRLYLGAGTGEAS